MKNKIKVPSLAKMQLGPYNRSVTCGCLMFHANEIDRQIGRYCVNPKVTKLDRNHLSDPGMPNTLPNRRAAMSILHKALRQCGYRIARDKKTAVLK